MENAATVAPIRTRSPRMSLPRRCCSLLVLILLVDVAVSQDAPQQRKGRFGPGPSIPKAQLTPHWFDDDARFWYRNALAGGGKEFVLVESEAGKKAPAFD